MVSVDSVLVLKKKIKTWEYKFQQNENRQPTKADIKADSEVYKLYKVYRAAKSKSLEVEYEPAVEQKEANGPRIDVVIADPYSDIESDTENKSELKTNIELGPTPQANGKVLSILDFRLTPPDSSPLKPKVPLKRESKEDEELFKTPTKKTRRIEMIGSSHKSQSNNSIAMKLQLASAERNISPIKAKVENNVGNTTLETPRYLSRNTRKFDFVLADLDGIELKHKESEEIVSSPPDNYFDTDFVTPTKSKIALLTPTKTNSQDFLVSPSPFKTQRILSRKLSDIFYGNNEIPEEEAIDDSEMTLNAADEVVDEVPSVVMKKSRTQKRTTRRWKMKPVSGNQEDDRFEGKNIHDEIKKIDEEKNEELKKYLGSEDEIEQDDLEDLETIPPSDKSTKNSTGKIKPISMNYQRLKINDPRSKAFKRRMKNRR